MYVGFTLNGDRQSLSRALHGFSVYCISELYIQSNIMSHDHL